jgi:hypothetical protein
MTKKALHVQMSKLTKLEKLERKRDRRQKLEAARATNPNPPKKTSDEKPVHCSPLDDIDVRIARALLVHPQQRRKFVSDDEKLEYLKSNPIE